MKEGIVVVAKYIKEWQHAQHGPMFDHQIVFDNGDTGTYTSKSPEQAKFKVGEKVSYEVIPGKEGWPGKIKPVAPEFTGGLHTPGGGGKSFGDPKTMVLAYAKDLAVARIAAGMAKDVNVRNIAKDFVEMMAVLEGTHTTFSSNSKPLEKPTTATPPPVTEDDLPF